MNKITEIIELDPRKLDLERLPIERCVFDDDENLSDEVKYGLLKSLAGVRHFPHLNRLMFVAHDGNIFPRCAEVISRHPRQVPEGVAPLPDDKPFLAFLGKYTKSMNAPYLLFAYISPESGWESDPWAQVNRSMLGEGQPVAIDVSNPWTKKHYPEFVEAMGYEPVYKYYLENRKPKELVRHKLGGKEYDLEWNLIENESQSLFATPEQLFDAKVKEINKWLSEWNVDYDKLPTRSWSREDLLAIPQLLLLRLLNKTIPEVENQKTESAEYGHLEEPSNCETPDRPIKAAVEKRLEWMVENMKHRLSGWEIDTLKLALSDLNPTSHKVSQKVEHQNPRIGGVKLSKKPLNVEDYISLGVFHGIENEKRLAFNAGEERGKWKATNWKYETVKEAFNSYIKTVKAGVNVSFADFEFGFNMARETKDSE